MADQTITIPDGTSEEEYRGWISELIDTHLASGDNVIFKDPAGNERNVNYFVFLADTTTERSLKSRGVGMTDAQAVTGSFMSGVPHPWPMSKIFSAGTTQNGQLRTRMA